MKDILALVPVFTDRAGRTVYNVHPLPEGRKSPGSIKAAPILGQMRIPPDDQEPIEWEPAVEVEP